ncbi:MAG: hypothetical protein IID09_00855 [Candidatus Hydrogenedentes bacterium]|nr:hypothetical protein [Candidatus Hydrogenedentota bacterium]
MKYALLSNVLLFVLGLTASAAAQSAADELTWLNDYGVARAHARDTGRPLLVSFRCVP